MKQQLKSYLNKVPYISKLRQQIGEQGAYPAGHYYSPIPSKDDVNQGIKGKMSHQIVPDIDLSRNEQLMLIDEFSEFYRDLPFTEKQGEGSRRYYYDQKWFCYSDAIMLYCMIRKFGPKRIVEVGSGYSSAVMLDTLESLNREDYGITFIEPYPDRLHSMVDVQNESRVSLLESGVQNVDIDLFKALDKGDLLFIDSSHVVKYGSDVHFLVFEVLPVLKSGVIVHFHDIFWPFEYPAGWLSEGRYWNECYFLRAFLSGNSNWKILFFNDYVNKEFPEIIRTRMPLCQRNFGGSIYLQKIGGPET